MMATALKIVLVLALVVSILVIIPITTTAAPSTAKKDATRIVLDTPAREVGVGDTVTFTGKLVRALDSRGIGSVPVTIYHKGAIQNTPLETGFTNADGFFSIRWQARPVDTLSNNVNIFASNAANNEYESSRTFEYNIRISTKYSIDVRADRSFYHVGDRAVFAVEVKDPSNNPINPREIHAFFDGLMVTLTQIDRGHYRYATPQLTHGIHSMSVSVKILTTESKLKADFNSISSSAQIHAIKRPTTLNASVNDRPYFIGDEITVRATLHDVIRGGYITDKDLKVQMALPDESKRNMTVSSQGNTYVGKYVVNELDAIGMWKGSVVFEGDHALQSSDRALPLLQVNDYRVKPAVSQEGNVTTINFRSHEENFIEVYELIMKLDLEHVEIMSANVPSEWSYSYDNSTRTIKFMTENKPLKSGKSMSFAIETWPSIATFAWEARDIDSDVIAKGKGKV